MDLFKRAMEHYTRLEDRDDALVIGSEDGPTVVRMKNTDLDGLIDALKAGKDRYVIHQGPCDFIVDVSLGEDGSELLELPAALNARVEKAMADCVQLSLGHVGFVDASKNDPVSVPFAMNGSSKEVNFEGLVAKTLELGTGAMFVSGRGGDVYFVHDLITPGNAIRPTSIDTSIRSTKTTRPVSMSLPAARKGSWVPYTEAWALALNVPNWALRTGIVSLPKKYRYLFPGKPFPLDVSIGQESGTVFAKTELISGSNASILKAVPLAELSKKLASEVKEDFYPGPGRGNASPIRRFYVGNSIEKEDSVFMSYIPEKGFLLTPEHPTLDGLVDEPAYSEPENSEPAEIKLQDGSTWTPPKIGFSFTMSVPASAKHVGPSVTKPYREYFPKGAFLLRLDLGGLPRVVAVKVAKNPKLPTVYLKGVPRRELGDLATYVDPRFSKSGSTQAFCKEHDPEKLEFVYKSNEPPLYECLLPGSSDATDTVNAVSDTNSASTDYMLGAKVGTKIKTALSNEDLDTGFIPVHKDFRSLFPEDGEQFVVNSDNQGYVASVTSAERCFYIVRPPSVNSKLTKFDTPENDSNFKGVFKRNELKDGAELEFEVRRISPEPLLYVLSVLKTEYKPSA
ncbi:hypothetical protein KY329_01280 [Candidatus Woesearchaeota archaeon]|nr:hypothetical protein [Candidatus Woesearchaeota archaeon]